MAFRQADIDNALEKEVKGIVEYRSPLCGRGYAAKAP